VTHWNHRILRQETTLGTETFATYALHEVYYDDDGKPGSWTEQPVAIVGDDFKSAAETYLRMSNAFMKPVLAVVDDKLVETDEQVMTA